MRPIWTGSIGFGLVNIPVKMYSATQDSTLNLDMLDKKDHSNIRFKRVNENTGKEVAWENIVKGYKINNKYVVLNPKDFEAVSAEKTKVIAVEDFINEDDIESIYFETPYFLEPDKSGAHAYALFREALKKAKKVGVATYVMRNKEILAVLKPYKNSILLNRLRFDQEIRDVNELKIPDKTTVKPAELTMALSLIDQLTAKWDPSKYHDTYDDELMKIIKARAKGTKIAAPPKMKVAHKSGDLMSQLKASLNGKKKKAS